jgi:alkanesulfonate monooxygenase SsuD/methylene tetrahydromethanopterin reductase-like flavin-dependent oxidoreductase (luciferase family)
MVVATGVSLPLAQPGTPAVAAAAGHVEALGFDSVWAGDHLSTGRPLLDSVVALATAAGATERVGLGFGVLQAALRHPAWLAKQLASLQYVSGNRLLLGVGAGGEVADEWTAAGVPLPGRGERTDRILAMLPDLLAGKPTELVTEPAAPTVTLAPGVPMPPLWVGGGSPAALRRAARFGDGWLASMTTPADLRARTTDLADIAAQLGRPTPRVGALVFLGPVNAAGQNAARDGFVARLRSLGKSPEAAARLVTAGPVDALAQLLDEYAAAGASQLVLCPIGENWTHTCETLAEARQRMS